MIFGRAYVVSPDVPCQKVTALERNTEDRCQVRSLILPSQMPVTRCHEQIGDPTVADGILDHLVHNAHRIEMRGDSMRKESQEAECIALSSSGKKPPPTCVLRRGRLMLAEVLSNVLPNITREGLGNLNLGKVSARKDLDVNIGPLRYPKIRNAQPDFAEAANRPGDWPFRQIFRSIGVIFEPSPYIVSNPGHLVLFQSPMIFGAKIIPRLRIDVRLIPE